MSKLVVDNLSVGRGGVPVLQGLSFTLLAGEALILRGPNGAGKTTLLRAVAGLQPAMEGQINVEADTIAYSGHTDGIKATLSVRENLEFWAAIYGVADIDGAMAAFELTPLATRAANCLSAGQKRRLGLARLLVTGRPIWVLDEPTVSLDKLSVGMFADAVRAHLSAGGSALIATHIDLGIKAREFDVAPFKATTFLDEAFL